MDSQREHNQERAQGRNQQHGGGRGSAKSKGRPRDTPEQRRSKTLSWILRHGSQKEGLDMRSDGYVRVDDLFKLPKMRDVDFAALEQIVQKDNKSRYHLLHEPDESSGSSAPIWWIRANQGHSLKSVELELQPINSASDIPTGIAVHGTTRRAWETIREQGIHKMTRNHIHLAQGVPGSGVISGMRNSSQILISIDVQKAIDAGIKFHMSMNGVVLTDGDAAGFLRPEFFSFVEGPDHSPVTGWERAKTAAHDTIFVLPGKTPTASAVDGSVTEDGVQANSGAIVS
ncbi:KptA family-domain-containing protein [Amylocystis lapponica]|nr:KptA family-domain-containing protein [Amylocystis lapponica]